MEDSQEMEDCTGGGAWDLCEDGLSEKELKTDGVFTELILTDVGLTGGEEVNVGSMPKAKVENDLHSSYFGSGVLSTSPKGDFNPIIISSSSGGGNGRTVGVVTGRIRKLDEATCSTIRKTLIINKVSDVVRELVDNSVDSEASSIKVLLTNFGLDKIEVRDTGHGISPSDLGHAVAGGYSSKLRDKHNLSSQTYYGFRGEALASICSLATVWITSKTVQDVKAIKYELDKNSRIISDTTVASGNGTIVLAADLFKTFPVRRHYIQDKNRQSADLKEIEAYLKAVAIANPQIYISFHHNSNLIWNKSSVGSIDQALITVLGHATSKNLSKVGPVTIEVLEGDGKQRTIEAFFLKTPIDMKTMSFTSRKMTFLFLNRKRVYIQEFEKLIQRYTVAAIEKPAPADSRRFPVAVVNITVPADEVDFNREMDKSKVFLVHKDLIVTKLEELLRVFYCITSLNERSRTENEIELVTGSDGPVNVDNATRTAGTGDISNSNATVQLQPQQLTGETDRQSAIQLFMNDIPAASTDNLSQSPIKKPTEGSDPFCAAKSPLKKNVDRLAPSGMEIEVGDLRKFRQVPSVGTNSKTCIASNFEFNLDDILMDSPPLEEMETTNDKRIPDCVEEKETSNMVRKDKTSRTGINDSDARTIDMNEWVRGRIPDSNGEMLQSVHVLNHPPPSTVNPLDTTQQPQQYSISDNLRNRPATNDNALDRTGVGFETVPRTHLQHSFMDNSGNAPSISRNVPTTSNSAFDRIRSGFGVVKPHDPKRPKLHDNRPSQTRYSQLGVSLSGTPRQVNLDSFQNWETPAPKRSSSENRFRGPSPGPSGCPSTPSAASTMHSVLSTSVTNTRRNSGDGPRILMPSIWDMYVNKQSKSRNTKQQPSLSIVSYNVLESNNHGAILGSLSDPSMYTSKINDHIGVFHPMNMLQEFPSLRYELKIDLEKVSEPGTELDAQYIVAKEYVPKLFNEFITRVDPACNKYPKIFHKLQCLNNISGN